MKLSNAILTLIFCLFFGNSRSQTQADSLELFARSYIGTPYHYGSCDPQHGFDCSGFIYHVYSKFNIKVPRASMGYEKHGKIIPLDSVRSGDILVFTGTNSKVRKPGHVGMVVASDDKQIRFIHSSSGAGHRGVIISSLTNTEGYRVRLLKAVRISKLHAR